MSDIPLLGDLGKQMSNGKCFCLLGPSAISAVTSALKFFNDEIREHIETGHCPLGYTHSMPHETAAVGGTYTGVASPTVR